MPPSEPNFLYAGNRIHRDIYYPADNPTTGLWLPRPTPGNFATRWFVGPSQSEHDPSLANFGEGKIPSAGPERNTNTASFTADLIYDPTNGTSGDIIWS
jgi:hypothetical protein